MASETYEYRRGFIEVIDAQSGLMRCRECSATWCGNIRSGGGYHRGTWTCYRCGANSKGKFGESREHRPRRRHA